MMLASDETLHELGLSAETIAEFRKADNLQIEDLLLSPTRPQEGVSAEAAPQEPMVTQEAPSEHEEGGHEKEPTVVQEAPSETHNEEEPSSPPTQRQSAPLKSPSTRPKTATSRVRFETCPSPQARSTQAAPGSDREEEGGSSLPPNFS
eukprot:303799_1